MDENISGVLTGFREVYGRETLSRLEFDRSVAGWTQSLHNGFEIWWLAGMPIMLVFLLTLLSVSVVSGMSGLEKKIKWEVEVPVPGFVWKLAARLCGPSAIGTKQKSKTKLLRADSSVENLKVREP